MKPSERVKLIDDITERIAELKKQLSALRKECTHVFDDWESARSDDGACAICGKELEP